MGFNNEVAEIRTSEEVKKPCMLWLNEEDVKKIEDLKKIANTKTRTKTLLFCLKKTHELFSDQL